MNSPLVLSIFVRTISIKDCEVLVILIGGACGVCSNNHLNIHYPMRRVGEVIELIDPSQIPYKGFKIALFNISGDYTPIPSSVNEVKTKTWRPRDEKYQAIKALGLVIYSNGDPKSNILT